MEKVVVKPEMQILMDRIERFGSIISLDEYGSYLEYDPALDIDLTDSEWDMLAQAEAKRRNGVSTAVA
jgi:hypothetical protein